MDNFGGGYIPNTAINTDDGFWSNFNFDDFSKSLTGLAGILNSFGGLQNLNLAKDQFNFQKDLTGVNLANQAKLVNSELETRQRSRNARGVGIPLEEYMRRFGVSGNINGSTNYNGSQAISGASNGTPDLSVLSSFNNLNKVNY